MSESIYVAQSSIGKGVFASRRFSAGERLLILEGAVRTFDELEAMGAHAANAVQIGPASYLDPIAPGLYLNHSCRPNAGIAGDRNVIALRDIKAYEEVRIDYSTTMQEGFWTMECLCQEKACRGIIGDFSELPEILREEYLSLGIVQSFICQGSAYASKTSRI